MAALADSNIRHLGKGKAWETAIGVCDELALQHTTVTFN